MRIGILVASLGLVAAISYPLVNHQLAGARENAAIEWLRAIGEAQARFRTTHGGYAATLQSLVEPCGGQAPLLRATLTDWKIVDAGHEVALRPARGAVDGPLDCHGRVSSSDFYVSARPVVVGRDGFRGMAMTSAGHIFVFFDGVPPAEGDMAPGGAAELQILKLQI